MSRADAQRQASVPVHKGHEILSFFSFFCASPGGLQLSRRKETMKAAAALVIINAGASSHLAGLRTVGCIRWSRWPGVGPSAAAVWPHQCKRGRRNCPAAACPTGGRSCAVGTRLYATQHNTGFVFFLFFLTNVVNNLILERLRKKTLKRNDNVSAVEKQGWVFEI